ncbi:MAG: hypothetical protein M1825_005520 [Sarcosagium campestre]|nr:MAG: hypothetical protein M1825_005520 [Sarcosagium campestre]
MDIAYDHIQEEVLSPDEAAERERDREGRETQAPSLNAEFAEAYKVISASPWGAKFGAFVGNVKKQGETAFEGAKQEYTAASSQATKGFTDIVNRARSVSTPQPPSSDSAGTLTATDEASKGDSDASSVATAKDGDHSNSDTFNDASRMLARLKVEATKRLKDIEKAEDAADEALLKFGTNIRNFLRDAVSIAAPEEGQDSATGKDGKSTVLFESKDRDGKRVIHTTRFDAQLHVIHSGLDNFAKDPNSPEFAKWKEAFSIEKKTDDIVSDLEKYQELRSAMEKLMPADVKYEDFWTRYYFLRHVIETEEQRRRELLKGASTSADEEITWDEEDSDTEAPPSATTTKPKPSSLESSSTLRPTNTTNPTTAAAAAAAKTGTSDEADTSTTRSSADAPARKSNDQHSLPDSDASYDVVSGAPSGAPSHAPGSPRAEKKPGQEESDEEEDWE